MIRTNEAYTFQSVNIARRNLFSENINNESEHELFKLFISELKEMYWSEVILIKVLAKMIKNTSDTSLYQLLQLNLETTHYKITRLEDIFVALDEKVASKKCVSIEEMIIEINDYIKHYEKGKFKDEMMMLNFHKITQFKMDTFDSLYEYAKLIGEYEVAGFFMESLNEELELDSKLTEMSDSTIHLNISSYF